MADLEQSFMRSMSLRGVNYGSAGPQVQFIEIESHFICLDIVHLVYHQQYCQL